MGGYFGVGMHSHFSQGTGAVGADGFYAEAEFIGNLGHGLSVSNHSGYLVLAVGKAFMG